VVVAAAGELAHAMVSDAIDVKTRPINFLTAVFSG